MANINVTFTSNYSESRQWAIWDLARDPNSPPVIFNGYLGPGESTQATIYADGTYGRVLYQRSDGAPTVADSISDGSNVSME